jgi:hypothetical protein
MLETQSRWYLPAWGVLGWHIGFWNLIGMALHLVDCGEVALADLNTGAFGFTVDPRAEGLTRVQC